MDEKTHLIGVDWGLSQLRAYRIGEDGRLLESKSSNAGIASVKDRAFEAVLGAVLSDWLGTEQRHPILLCGMIGSRQGWKEAPYASCPVRLDALSLVRIESALGEVRIVGGARTKDAYGHHDVMRGEETQIFGLADRNVPSLVITPGTHSKWSGVKDGAITGFRTYMTGELYALLKNHSTLGWTIAPSANEDIEEAPFEEGVRDALADPDMPHGVFNARTLALFQPQRRAAIPAYLSGLLVGYEIHGASRRAINDPIVIIGTPRLAKLYKLALAMAGFRDVTLADADTVTAKGLWRIWERERKRA